MAFLCEHDWETWDFFQRLDWCALDLLKNGLGVRPWVISIAYLKLILVQISFIFIILLTTPATLITSAAGAWQVFLRYAIYVHALLALGESDGPSVRWTGGVPGCFGLFTFARYRLTHGAMKDPLFQCFGQRRSLLDLYAYLVFLASAALAVFTADVRPPIVAIHCGCIAWFILFDYNAFLASHGPTFFSILVCACFPMSKGCIACAQLHMMILWFGSGLAKMGPWFSGVNGTLICASHWFSGQAWLFRLMYRSEDDLQPTFFAKVFGYITASMEWISPILLLCTSTPSLVWLGITMLMAMHVYFIILHVRDLYLWNLFCGIAAFFLFAGRGSLGFDHSAWVSAPWPLLITNCAQVVLFAWGSLYPDSVCYMAAHRHFAGNWPIATWLIRKDAASKLSARVSTFGKPPWDPIPDWVTRWGWLGPAPPLPQIGLYKTLSSKFLSALNMKYLPALLSRAIRQGMMNEFHVLDVNSMFEILYGKGTLCDPSRCQSALESLQESVGFEEGECMYLWIGAFPEVGRCCEQAPAHWKIVDAKAGILAQGSLTADMAQAAASLPSICQHSLVAGNDCELC